MKCMSSSEVRVAEETLSGYDLSEKEMVKALALIEKRAQDTSLPFKAYTAAHNAASEVVNQRK